MSDKSCKEMADALYSSFEHVKNSPLDLNRLFEHIALLDMTVEQLLLRVNVLTELVGEVDDGK